MLSKTALLDRISLDPNVMVGKPVIKGTRLTVEHVLSLLAGGMTVVDVLREYDGLWPEDIWACIAFAAKMMEDTTFVPLCDKNEEKMNDSLLSGRVWKSTQDQFWLAEIPSLDLIVQAERKEEIPETVSEAIELLVDPPGFEVKVYVEGGQLVVTSNDAVALNALGQKRRHLRGLS